MTPSPQAVLVERLSALLGFEDGADDVLEHLMSIESSQDLTDYLSQLLGRNDEEVQTFIKDVGRFQNGQPLSAPTSGEMEDSKPAAVPTPERTYDAKPKPTKREQPPKQPARAIFGQPSAGRVVAAAPTKQAKAPVAAPTKDNTSTHVSNDALAEKPLPAATASSTPAKKDPVKEKPPPKSHPPKGKASVVCGCFGSLHKPLTNCLYCGRISCEREGYNFCPFCGMLVEQVSGGEGSKAWEHKERLLRFDRDFARRTVVLDDQADFFTSNKSWLTEEERIAAEGKQAEQKEKLRTREKQTLDIAF